ELPVLLTRGPNNELKDPAPVNKKVGTGTHGTFDLHIDHSGHLSPLIEAHRQALGSEAAVFTVSQTPPILELVTKPLEDRADSPEDHEHNKQHIRQVMTDLVSVADQIEARAIGRNQRINVLNLKGVTVPEGRRDPAKQDASNYVGIIPADPA